MKMLFQIHLYELKIRTLYLIISYLLCFLICLIFKVELFFIISKIFLQFNTGFIYTDIMEPFMVYIKLSLFFSFVIILSIFFYFYSFFFFKSFYMNQIRIVLFLFFLFYLFIGFYFILFFKFFIPVVLKIFFLFERIDINSLLMISLEAKLKDYLKKFFIFIFVSLLITHLPLFLMLYILKFSNINNIKFRKYLYIIMIVVFLIVAPPDIFLQVLILPFLFFFIEFLFFYFCLIYILWK